MSPSRIAPVAGFAPRGRRRCLPLILLLAWAGCAPGVASGLYAARDGDAPGTQAAADPGAPPADADPGSDAPALPPTPAPAADPAGSALHTQNDQIVDGEGKSVRLHGVNWFGFNNAKTMLEGAEAADPLGGDFATVVLRLRALGFNAVRLPFSFKDLALPPKSFAQPCTLPSTAAVAQSVAAGGAAPALQPLKAPPQRSAGMCNDYLPSTSTRARFIYVVRFFIRNGFYVMIDDHLREDETVLSDGTVAWAAAWKSLLTDLTRDEPTVAAHLLVDVLNEPDAKQIAWAPKDGKPGLSDLYLAAMDAMQAVAPVLFVVEGTGQGGINVNWGDGFATDPALLAKPNMSDPRPFFTALFARPYVRRVVLSPHVYGPAVTLNEMDAQGSGLFSRLSNSFGKITRTGACVGATCVRFPIAVGEFGSTFADPRDVATLNDLSAYLSRRAPANDGMHNAVPNWFYWSWSPNSGDTGGLVQADNVSLQTRKITFLRALGL